MNEKVGDYAHCVAPLCDEIVKRLASGLLAGVAKGDGRGIIARMQQVSSDMQEAATVPLANRFALRPQKKYTFNLTSATVLPEKTEYQNCVVELLKEFYPNHTVEGKNVKVYTFVLRRIRSVAQMDILWRKKTFLSDSEVACLDQATKEFGVCRQLMTWKPVFVAPWDHVAHGMVS